MSGEIEERMKVLNIGKYSQEYREKVWKNNKIIKDFSPEILCTFECRYGQVEVIFVKKQGTKDSFYIHDGMSENLETIDKHGIESFFNNKKIGEPRFCMCTSYRSRYIRGNFRYDCTTRIGTTEYIFVTPTKIYCFDNLDGGEVRFTKPFVNGLVRRLNKYMIEHGMKPEIEHIKITWRKE